ncbi:MAG: DNA translocase FtsK 4TM domain-containing protein, partial [Pseudomonadota bacterium]
MAYQTRRDPLFDHGMQAALEKRGRELVGIGLLIAGLMAAAMMLSYTPDDPNWMASTDAPVQNWLGRTGASIAAPLFMIAGWGVFGIAIVLMVWGVRFTLHQGTERALGRLIFAPIAIAFGAIYGATLQPGAEWQATHGFGLGGLFGDTVMAFVLTVMPLGSSLAVKLMSFLMGVGIVVFGAFVLGFTRPEVARLVRFLLLGLVVAYAMLMSLLGRGASGAVRAARALQERQAERRAARAADAVEAEAYAATLPVIEAPEHEEPARPSLLARMPTLIKRPDQAPDEMPEQELIDIYSDADVGDGPADDRIKLKIADVIKSRVRSNPDVQAASVAPLTKGRGRGPVPLIANTVSQPILPPEPPLTAAASLARTAPPLTAPPVVEPVEEYVPEQLDVPMPEPVAEAPSIPVVEPRTVIHQPVRKPVQPSTRAQLEAQPKLKFEDTHPGFELPPLNLLESPTTVQRHHLSDEALEENARMLEVVLDDYGVKGEIVSVRPGPVVTMYELEPAPGLKASRVIGLADDIARSMAALSARVSTVPGRSVIGIELPNENREKVVLREILASRDFGDGNQKLPLALGKDIGGDPVVANLAKMPHLLIAGTTGSGKSVAINTMILSLLYKLTPEECRLIMIDPKMLELSVYDGIPHLLSPVVTDPKKAVVALKWVVGEMEERYRKMSKMGVRNIDGYNGRVKEALAKDEMFSRTVQTGFDDETGEPIFETEEFAPEAMPYIVVIVDEMADLMMVAGKEIEACIQRLAQMARASGIHLIMAT